MFGRDEKPSHIRLTAVQYIILGIFLFLAYGLWRLNWIHPFIEGNGRTARAASYYLLCARSGGLIGGRKIVPERIRDDRKPYYAALTAADRAWEKGDLDISDMEDYLAALLQEQLQDEGLPYEGSNPSPISDPN